MAGNGRQWHDALPKRGFPTLFNRNVPSNAQVPRTDFADDVDSAVWSNPIRSLEPRRTKEEEGAAVPREEKEALSDRGASSKGTDFVAKGPRDAEEGRSVSSPNANNNNKKNSVVVATVVVAAVVVTLAVVGVVVTLAIKKNKPEDEG